MFLFVTQTAEAQLKGAKERLFEQETRLAEQTKLIAELTLKVHTRLLVQGYTYINM